MTRRKESESGGRERLLAAATRLFAAKGYAATSVRDILRAANVTAPVLYYHFGSKQGLFGDLFREGIETLDEEVKKAVGEATTVAERVRAYCQVHVEVQERYSDLRWIAEALIAGPPKAAPRFDFKGRFAAMVQELADLVGAGVESGEFRACDPIAVALALLGAVEMTVRARRIGARLPGLANPLDGVLTVVLDGLRPPTAADGGGFRHARQSK
jgi:TetR/AcrR family transcriptional regulator